MKLLDFYADWCQPCKIMEPRIEELIAQGVEVEKINIEEDMDRAQNFGVMSIPTLVVLNGDTEVQRFTGITDVSDLKKALDL